MNDRFPAADFSSGSRELIHSHRHMTFEATTARGAAKRPSVAHQWPTFLRPQWPRKEHSSLPIGWPVSGRSRRLNVRPTTRVNGRLWPILLKKSCFGLGRWFWQYVSSWRIQRVGGLATCDAPRFPSCGCLVCLLTFRREPLGHSSQILRSCCHQKLIMSTAWTTQSQAIEFEDALEVSEEHFHLLSLPARLFVLRGCRDAPRFIACSFMDAAHDFAKLRIRTASILHRTAVTVHLARSVDDGVGFRDMCAGIPEWTPVAA